MLRTLMKSKIHRATVTEANLEYEGSITIDAELANAADLLPNERVEIYDVTNGSRLATYVIHGEPGSGARARASRTRCPPRGRGGRPGACPSRGPRCR